MADGFLVWPALEAATWQYDLPQAATPIMAGIRALNWYLSAIIIGVVTLVFGLLLYVMVRFNERRNPTPASWSHNTAIEIGWTLVPVFILVSIAVPSFRLIHDQNRIPPADLTLKITGHQWYWSYEYPDHGITLDAVMVDDGALQPGQPRLQTTDTVVVLPVGRVVRLQITADDVLHSWSMPAFGVKTDSVPGRLNETWVRIDEPGTYYGACAELCGVRHAFMPIAVEAVSPGDFDAWVRERTRAAGGTGTTRFPPGRPQPTATPAALRTGGE